MIPVEKDARNTGFYNKNLKQNFHQSTPSPFKKYHIEMGRFFPSVDHYNEQFWQLFKALIGCAFLNHHCIVLSLRREVIRSGKDFNGIMRQCN